MDPAARGPAARAEGSSDEGSMQHRSIDYTVYRAAYTGSTIHTFVVISTRTTVGRSCAVVPTD